MSNDRKGQYMVSCYDSNGDIEVEEYFGYIDSVKFWQFLLHLSRDGLEVFKIERIYNGKIF